jgi:hypothetical protein
VLHHWKDHQVHVFTHPLPHGCLLDSHALKRN